MSAPETPPGPPGVFHRVADTRDAVGVPGFGPIAEDLLGEPDVRPGERVLDVGCGRGPAGARGRLLSLNVGRPRANPWKRLPATGIDKHPVSGPVAVTTPGPKGDGEVGLAGDRAHDVKHHGGADQALYAYAREDLDRWQEQLGRDLADGRSFGENLTTVGLDVNGALVGERWRIGADVVLEVTGPRVPCATFAGWMDEPQWLKRFVAAAVPGAYLRVIAEGTISAGDPIEVVSRPDHDVTVALAFRAFTTEPHLLPRLLAAPALPEEDREHVRRYVARQGR